MTEPKKRGSVLPVVGDGLLLAATLAGLLRSFLSLYPDILERFTHTYMLSSVLSSAATAVDPEIMEAAQAAPLRLTILAVLLALGTLALWSRPKYRLPAAVGAALLLTAVGLYYRLYLAEGAQLVGSAISAMFHQRVGWFAPMTFLPTLPFGEQLDAVLIFLTFTLAVMALLLGWCVVRARSWWLTALLTLPALLPGLLANLYPDWPWFLLLCAGWCAMLIASLCRWAAPAARGGLTLVSLTAAGILLALLITVLPQEGYTRPDWAIRAEAALSEFVNLHLSFLSGGPKGIGAAAPIYTGTVDPIDLNEAGPLNFTGSTVLRITTNYSGPIYLRGAAFAKYNGVSWKPLDSEVYSQWLEEHQAEWSEQWVDESPLLYPSLLNVDGNSYSITVTNIGANDQVVYLPYGLRNQTFAELETISDSAFGSPTGRASHGVSFSPDLLDLDRLSPNGDADALRTELAYSEFVEEQYLQLQLSPALEGLLSRCRADYNARFTVVGGSADLTLEARERLDKAQWVADYLAQLCEYDPDTPYTPEGQDFIGYFLSESHRGYCMHFASAAVLMLRYLDVPARYVTGYAATADKNQSVNVPDSAAHAWVEIYLPRYGWYPVEVTPSYESDEPAPSASLPSQAAEPAPTPTPKPTPTPSAAPAPSAAPSRGPAASLPPSGNSTSSFHWRAVWQTAKWLLLGLAVLLAVWLGQFLPKRLRARQLNGADTNRAVLYGYRCLTQLERWGGTVDAAALELARKARFSQHTLTQKERQAMAELLCEQCRRIPEHLSPVRKLLFRYLWGIQQ